MAIDIIARGMIESSKSDISQLFDITKGGEIVSNESSYTISNAVDYPLLGLNLYGKSTQDGVPTPDTPVDIVSVGDSGTVNITSNNGGDITVTAAITSAMPWCGIPVESGGNYTDSNGQQWICDELVYDRIDGVGKIIKRTNELIFNGSENWILASNGKRVYVIVADNIKPKYSGTNSANALMFSNKYVAGSNNDTMNNKTCITTDFSKAFILYDERFAGDIAGLKADMAANNLRIVYALDTPQEIELTAAEVAELKVLQTFDGKTLTKLLPLNTLENNATT